MMRIGIHFMVQVNVRNNIENNTTTCHCHLMSKNLWTSKSFWTTKIFWTSKTFRVSSYQLVEHLATTIPTIFGHPKNFLGVQTFLGFAKTICTSENFGAWEFPLKTGVILCAYACIRLCMRTCICDMDMCIVYVSVCVYVYVCMYVC